jgi:hypothetical protein
MTRPVGIIPVICGHCQVRAFGARREFIDPKGDDEVVVDRSSMP